MTDAPVPRVPVAPGTVACPRCSARVAPDQDWCLICGAAARTRLVRAPNWKVPVALLVSVVTASVIALALAFVALTGDGGAVSGATGPSGPSVVAPVPAPVPASPTGATGVTGATG